MCGAGGRKTDVGQGDRRSRGGVAGGKPRLGVAAPRDQRRPPIAPLAHSAGGCRAGGRCRGFRARSVRPRRARPGRPAARHRGAVGDRQRRRRHAGFRHGARRVRRSDCCDRGFRGRGGCLPRAQSTAIRVGAGRVRRVAGPARGRRRARTAGAGGRSRRRWIRRATGSPLTCGRLRAGRRSGSGSTHAARPWWNWRPGTSIPAIPVSRTTRTSTRSAT